MCGALDGREPDKVLYIIDPPDAPDILARVEAASSADQASVVQSHARFVEVNPLEANKGAALAWLARHFGIPREQVMAVGDQDNDAPMIAWAGVGVAMGNGSPASQSGRPDPDRAASDRTQRRRGALAIERSGYRLPLPASVPAMQPTAAAGDTYPFRSPAGVAASC